MAERAFYRWRRKEKDAIGAANSSLTLVPVSVGMPATKCVVMLHSPGGWRIELPGGNASWLAMRFGASSEALTAEQRDLFQETLASELAAAEAELARQQGGVAATSIARTSRCPTGRQPLPEHLPRIEHQHEPVSCRPWREARAELSELPLTAEVWQE
jgi:hypothetical protein